MKVLAAPRDATGVREEAGCRGGTLRWSSGSVWLGFLWGKTPLQVEEATECWE